MQGVDPVAYMQLVAGLLDSLQDRRAIENALDEMEYLFEIIDPALQDNASDLIARLRAKLEQLTGGT
jgi:hypothetical protein